MKVGHLFQTSNSVVKVKKLWKASQWSVLPVVAQVVNGVSVVGLPRDPILGKTTIDMKPGKKKEKKKHVYI